MPGSPSPRGRRLRRTWPQRLLIAFNLVIVVSCLGAAAGLAFAIDKAKQVKRVEFPADVLDPTTPPRVTAAPGETLTPDTGPVPNTENFLVVGSDSRSCVDPRSPYAGAFLADGTGLSARTDTILVIRVDPATQHVAILSFPRDLWVHIGGHDNRINTAWAIGPDRLVRAIKDNFNIPINHYIDIDFCAFKGLVDAVGGVSVPFSTAVRDLNTGLDVTKPECHRMQGDEALAYARSRHFEYYDAKTKGWTEDGSADYGRIRRQQDFIRRALHRALDKGGRNLATLNDLINVGLQDVKFDQTLTFDDLFRLAQRLRNLDPETVQSFTIQGEGTVINDASVILPADTKYNRVVLDVFRGKAQLADVATAGADTTTTHLPPVTTTTVRGSTTAPIGTGPTTTVGPTTIPTVVVPTTLSPSITPPADPTCH